MLNSTHTHTHNTQHARHFQIRQVLGCFSASVRHKPRACSRRSGDEAHLRQRKFLGSILFDEQRRDALEHIRQFFAVFFSISEADATTLDLGFKLGLGPIIRKHHVLQHGFDVGNGGVTRRGGHDASRCSPPPSTCRKGQWLKEPEHILTVSNFASRLLTPLLKNSNSWVFSLVLGPVRSLAANGSPGEIQKSFAYFT